MYDLVIRDACLLDGLGSEPFVGHVFVREGKIARIVRETEWAGVAPAREEVAARGAYLSPGFIDVHSHDDFAVLLSPELPWKLLQGVTSIVVGNCGIGAAPFPAAEDWLQRLHPGAPYPDYSDYSGYFARLDAVQPSTNVAVLAGHGTLRRAAAPQSHGPLDASELAELQRQLDLALDAGVVGLSAGLIYEPGLFADGDELMGLCRRMKSQAPLFTIHLRSEADHLLEAIDEALEVCRGSGVSLQLSHHKAHGRNNWGLVKESLARVDAARAEGLDVGLDLYPYAAGSTVLSAVMERGGLSGGPILGHLLPEDIVIASSSVEPGWAGQSIQDLSESWGLEPLEAARRISRRDPGIWVIVHAMSDDDVRTVMAHPSALIGSDGLPTSGGRPHPRLWGTFPRVLGHYVRATQTLGLSEAVAKMTGRSAQRFGLRDRGTLTEGGAADLVLFDAKNIDAGSSYESPEEPPLGILGVWVNGERVVRNGQHLGARAGRALRAS